jgi:CO/xanthine dehydrogenase FAD-binding subunit
VRNPVIDISAISEIAGIQTTAEAIEIGGRTTWSQILATPLPRGFEGLKSAAREVGAVQIQNTGTIAGNLCNASPAADGIPALLALDATVTLACSSGERSVPLSEFVVGNRKTVRRPEEILTRVSVPRRLENSVSTFSKLGARKYLVISIAMIAVNLLLDDAATISEALVAIGSCSLKALRLHALEEALVGATLTTGIGKLVGAEHLALLSPIDDVRATAVYRRDATQVLASRALEDCARKAA